MDTQKVNQIQVTERSIQVSGKPIVIRILALVQGQYMTVADAAVLLGVEGITIRRLLAEHGLAAYAMNAVELRALKNQGILPLRTRTANLLPKDTIKALVRILRTPEANAAYEQVWQDAAELHAGKAQAQPIAKIANALKDTIEVVQDQEVRITAVETQVQTIEQDFGDLIATRREVLSWPKLSYTDSKALHQAIEARAKSLGLKDQDAKRAGYSMMGKIKGQFLPKKLYRNLTCNHITAAEVPAALELIAAWQPK